MERTMHWNPDDINCIVEMIHKHQIVPVIGADVYYIKQGEEEISFSDYVFRKIVENFIETDFRAKVIRECTGSNLRRMKKLQERLVKYGKEQRGRTPTIYSCITSLLNSQTIRHEIQLRESVKDFLQHGNFPLIITTCYIDLLEELLVAPRGKRYRRVGYYCQEDQDIEKNLDDTPTIFHLFGISESGAEPMVTEEDFLRYLHFLHSSKAPSNLKKYLQSRTALSLGCNIPDWTFRFILLSLMEKDGEIKGRTNLLGGAVMRNIEEDVEFQEFLEDISYLPGADVDTILRPIDDRIYRPSLFLSYSAKENTNEWDGIQMILTKLEPYYKVWFFAEQTKKEYGERYWDLIQDGLKECDIFMTVVTDEMVDKMRNIPPDGPVKDRDAGFLWEWKMMMDEQERRPEGREALCLGYFLTPLLDQVQDLIHKYPLKFLKPLFDDNQNITNVSPLNFDPTKITCLNIYQAES